MKNEHNTNKNQKNVTRRDFLRVASMATLGAAYLVKSPSIVKNVFASTPKTLRVAVLNPSHCALPLVNAELSGIFRENGLKVELQYFSKMKDIVGEMIKGELDIAQVMSPIFFSLNLGAGPFKDKKTQLVTAQVAGTNGGILVAGKNSGITNPKNLIGKNIGIMNPLMIHRFLFNKLLKAYKINPETDLNVKYIEKEGLIPALERGEIDAFINPEPLPSIAVSKGIGKDIMITKNIWFKHPCCIVSARREMLDKEPELFESIYRATIKSGLMANDVSSRKHVIEKCHRDSRLFENMSIEMVLKAFLPGRSDFDPFPFYSQAKGILTLMEDEKIITSQVDKENIAKDLFKPDITKKILLTLGETPPNENSRREKILDEMVT